jgi:MFS family permease
MNTAFKKDSSGISLHAIIIFILASAFIFYKYALEMAPDVLNLTWQHDLGLTPGQIGNIAASYYYAYMILQIPIGLIADSWGVRKVSIMGLLCCVAGSLVLSFAHGFWLAELGRFITGLGAAGAFICGVKLITIWFPARLFAPLVGLFIMLGILGGVGGHQPLADLIHAFGWRASLHLAAVIGFVLIVLYLIFLKDKQHVDQDSSSGTSGNLWHGLRVVLSSKQSWMISIYSGFMFAPLVVLGGVFGVSTLRGLYTITVHQATFSAQALFVGFALCAPVSGWLSDKMGRRIPLMVAGPLLAMLVLLAIYFHLISISLLPIAMFLFGFMLGGFLPCFSFIKEVNPLLCAGCAVGFMNTFEAAFSGFAATVAGHLPHWLSGFAFVSTVGPHKLILIFLLIEMLVGMLFLIGLRETNCRQAEF